MKKLSRLLGLTDEAPKPGHWLEGLRSAGTTNVPATTGEVNTSAVERLMNTPMDRRTFMEKTGQAAQAASMANRMGGALEELMPKAAESVATNVPQALPALQYLDNIMTQGLETLTPQRRKRIVSDWDMQPEELFEGHRELEHELSDLRLTDPNNQKQSVDEVIDHLTQKVLGPDAVSDDALDYANQLMSAFKSLGLRGERHKKLPDFWDLREGQE